MDFDKSTDQTLRNDRRHASATPWIALLNRKLGPSPAPRMLTPSEIALLRQCVQEVAEVTHEVLASKDNT